MIRHFCDFSRFVELLIPTSHSRDCSLLRQLTLVKHAIFGQLAKFPLELLALILILGCVVSQRLQLILHGCRDHPTLIDHIKYDTVTVIVVRFELSRFMR